KCTTGFRCWSGITPCCLNAPRPYQVRGIRKCASDTVSRVAACSRNGTSSLYEAVPHISSAHDIGAGGAEGARTVAAWCLNPYEKGAVNPDPAIQTANYAKYAKGKRVEWTKAFTSRVTVW